MQKKFNYSASLYIDIANVRRIMTQNLLTREALTPSDFNRNNVFNLVESIKNYIFENDCPNLSLDVSHLNIIDASKVTILCSTYHYAKYPHGEISWLINSSEVQSLIKPMNLGNVRLILA